MCERSSRACARTGCQRATRVAADECALLDGSQRVQAAAFAVLAHLDISARNAPGRFCSRIRSSCHLTGVTTPLNARATLERMAEAGGLVIVGVEATRAGRRIHSIKSGNEASEVRLQCEGKHRERHLACTLPLRILIFDHSDATNGWSPFHLYIGAFEQRRVEHL